MMIIFSMILKKKWKVRPLYPQPYRYTASTYTLLIESRYFQLHNKNEKLHVSNHLKSPRTLAAHFLPNERGKFMPFVDDLKTKVLTP